MFQNLLRIQVEAHFPKNTRGRPALLSFDDAYDDILKVVRTGMQWRQLQPKHVSFITVFKTMHKWNKADVFRVAYQNLLRLYSRRRRPRYYAVDSSFVKNIYGSDCVGRNPTDRGRKASKMPCIVDDLGVPFGVLFTPANQSDLKLFDSTLNSTLTPLDLGKELYADKGYDSKANRAVCARHGLRDRIFRRRTKNGRRTHARRGIIERFFSWVDKYRRLLVRYEKYISVYTSMTFLACGMMLQLRFQNLNVSIQHEQLVS